jgi:hypothetical protein
MRRPLRNGGWKGHFLVLWLGRAAILALAGCGASVPGGVERIATDAQTAFWSASSRRLVYVEGRFPNRTYAGKLGRYDSRTEPADRVVLVIEVLSGRILSEDALGVAGAAALGHPAWSPDPVAVWNGKDGVIWKAFGAEKTGGLLKGPSAWRALLLDEPYLVVAEKQSERPRMVVYDMRDGRPTAEWRVALTGSPLALRPDGTALSARWMSETGGFVLESGDPKTGRRIPLLEAEGEIETAVETTAALYAIAKDPARRNDTGKDFLAPRVLLVIESGGQRWSVPWTSHRGAFLGADPRNGRLLFAVIDRDRPAVWSIAPTRAALAAAGPAIDGK